MHLYEAFSFPLISEKAFEKMFSRKITAQQVRQKAARPLMLVQN